jgi:hypothetical protein
MKNIILFMLFMTTCAQQTDGLNQNNVIAESQPEGPKVVSEGYSVDAAIKHVKSEEVDPIKSNDDSLFENTQPKTDFVKYVLDAMKQGVNWLSKKFN